MKITIDTTFYPHSIMIEDHCSIGELTDFLSKFYPDFEWRDVKISSRIFYQNGGYGGAGTLTNPASTFTYSSDTNTLTNSRGEPFTLTKST